MNWVSVAFYCFAGMTVLAALGVISARNPVHSALALMVAFFSAACIWLLADAEFLGITLIMVYIGAVMVMFLFVVMMLDVDLDRLRQGWVRYLPAGVLVSLILLSQIVVILDLPHMWRPADGSASAMTVSPKTSHLLWLARALFSQFSLPFEYGAIILTVAVIAAVMLTLRHRRQGKSQNPAQQVRADARQRLRLIAMPSARSESAISAQPQDPTHPLH